jgi:hypothetical protein
MCSLDVSCNESSVSVVRSLNLHNWTLNCTILTRATNSNRTPPLSANFHLFSLIYVGLAPRLNSNSTQSQIHFTIGDLLPIISSWSQAPRENHDQRFLQLNPCDHSPYVTQSLTRRWVCLLWICLACRQIYISHIYQNTNNFCFCNIYESFISIGFAKKIMPI